MSKKRISTPQPDAQEKGYLRNAGELLNQGRAGLSQGAFAQNLLAPYLYDQAGLDVQYEDRSPRFQELAAQRAKAQTALTTLQSAVGGKARRAVRDQLAATGEYESAKNKKGVLKGGKLKKYLKAQIQKTSKEEGELAAAPLQIKAIKENAQARAEREREGALYKQEQELLQKSLSMTPEDVLAADPALRRQLLEEQAKLEQQQVQQFGGLSGAQGGTVGAVQNAAMAQRRAEAISNARRENIGLYAGLQTQQGAYNTQKAAAKQQLGTVPSSLQQQSGLNFGQLAQGYGGLMAQKQQQKQMQFQANAFNQTQPSIGESILKGIGSLLQPFKQEG